ncbi:MAG: hypothetical protein LBT46_12875 [Planctomycetaceae bacterium]|jgi:hypothetical protein|nr:hypothetical protein [Planctomycetaceae bacterium]
MKELSDAARALLESQERVAQRFCDEFIVRNQAYQRSLPQNQEAEGSAPVKALNQNNQSRERKFAE